MDARRRIEGLPPPTCSSSGACDWVDDWHDAFWWDLALEWLAERVGFWPLFLAVGAHDDDRQMTGYSSQWHRERVGQSPNQVLFSYAAEPAGAVYSDFLWWHSVLNGFGELGDHREQTLADPPGPFAERTILKRSWSRSRWLRKAASDPGTVQAAVPRLDLRGADEVWCRNRTTKDELVRRGFPPELVHVRRLPVLR